MMRYIFLFLSCFQANAYQPGEDAKLMILLDDFIYFLENRVTRSLGENGELPSEEPDLYSEDIETLSRIAAGLDDLDRSALTPEDRINMDLARSQIQKNLDLIAYKSYLTPLGAENGFHIYFSYMPSRVRLETVEDCENYLRKLRRWPELVNSNIALLCVGLDTGDVSPAVIFDKYEEALSTHIVEDPGDSIYYKPFLNLSDSMSEQEQARFQKLGRQAVAEFIVPGYRRFLEFMVETYIPNASDDIGLYALPRGRESYASLVRRYTSLDITPAEVHEIGLAEVARIRAEMLEVIRESGFEGDFHAFLEFLRTDERFYARTAEELLMRASYLAKTMDANLPKLFGKLPRQPYGVEPVPEHLAPFYTVGRYRGALPESGNSGYFLVNTYDLKSRPLYILEALTCHEAVPGHHLQVALRYEQDSHPIRRYAGNTAFGEGWALYAEYLGEEVGFYKDPYSKFGRLSFEMLRACRLVVDTGIHEFGWSRDRVVAYLAENTAQSMHEINTETDRYIGWPGQALAYKIGELKIKELRRLAETELGKDFDIREFHDRVLANGSILLTSLEDEIKRYISETRQASADKEVMLKP